MPTMGSPCMTRNQLLHRLRQKRWSRLTRSRPVARSTGAGWRPSPKMMRHLPRLCNVCRTMHLHDARPASELRHGLRGGGWGILCSMEAWHGLKVRVRFVSPAALVSPEHSNRLSVCCWATCQAQFLPQGLECRALLLARQLPRLLGGRQRRRRTAAVHAVVSRQHRDRRPCEREPVCDTAHAHDCTGILLHLHATVALACHCQAALAHLLSCCRRCPAARLLQVPHLPAAVCRCAAAHGSRLRVLRHLMSLTRPPPGAAACPPPAPPHQRPHPVLRSDAGSSLADIPK